MADPWTVTRTDEKAWGASRLLDRMMSYGKSIENASMEGIEVELEDDGKISFFVEEGDTGGRGYERNSAVAEMDFETARSLVEWLAPILYGEDEGA